MENSFKEKWENYTNLFWSPIFDLIYEDAKPDFSLQSIILWGWIPYHEYKKTNFANSGKLKFNNENLNVYYYCRNLENQYLSFFFVNTINHKNLILNTKDENLDNNHLFIKKLHQKNLSIYKIFNHPYSLNCWDVMKEQFENSMKEI